MRYINELLSIKEAASLWFLNEDTIQEAIKDNIFKEGIDIFEKDSEFFIDKKSMKREYGEAKVSHFSSDLKKEIIDLILENRLDNLMENIANDNVENGYKFELSDLFIPIEWEEVAIWPGNWRLGKPFASKIKDFKYIERIDKNGTATYKINLDKYKSI